MPRINEDLRIALRLVKNLKSQNKVLDSTELAKTSGTTKFFVIKIMQDLVSSGIVESIRGASGGFKARRKPVTALQIARALGYSLDKKTPRLVDEEIENSFHQVLSSMVFR